MCSFFVCLLFVLVCLFFVCVFCVVNNFLGFALSPCLCTRYDDIRKIGGE